MFGRKRKKEQENPLGDLSASYESPFGATVTPSANPTPATPGGGAGASAPGPGVPTPGTPAAQQTTITFGSMTPGAVPANMQAMLGQILGANSPITELISEIKADPQGFRNRIMQQAQAAGVSTYVMTPQGMAPTGGTGQPAQQHVDVIDELTKAAELHDKGALTDEEFEGLKKKLLGQ
jgi:Short C-terminal domain